MQKTIKLSVRDLTGEELSRVSDAGKDFPQIAITMTDVSTNETSCCYIYPLRGYFFQIGGLDANGAIIQGNHFFGGAKGLIQKCRRIGMGDNNIKDIFNNDAAACILKFIEIFSDRSNIQIQEGTVIPTGVDYNFMIDPIIGSMQILHNGSAWMKFINHTFEYFAD
jgi:hypothetical protein